MIHLENMINNGCKQHEHLGIQNYCYVNKDWIINNGMHLQ